MELKRIGETKINNYGSKMEIIDYIDSKNITVKFENGYIVKGREYKDFKKGKIKSLYDKSVFGNGYIGEGKYLVKINGVQTKQYINWYNMIRRCYSESFHKKEPTYESCTVCEEWHNFQNFAKWFDENYYECGENLELDKDILNKSNKIYSPETCVLVPTRINLLFTKRQKSRGEYPIGVSYSKREKKYQSRCNVFSYDEKICKFLGYYNTPEEAFYKYKEFKEDYIKKVAEEYKDVIPQNLYNAMYNYVVEITD